MKYEERQKLGEILTELQGIKQRLDLADPEQAANAMWRELAFAREIAEGFDPADSACHVCGHGYWDYVPANPGCVPDYQDQMARAGVTQHLARHAAEMARGLYPTRDTSAWNPLRLTLKIIGDRVRPVAEP